MKTNKVPAAEDNCNSNSEVFLEQKRKKKWVDKSGHNCFMMHARSLFITWGADDYWSWDCFKETSLIALTYSSSEENIEVVKLTRVCWLDVRGKFKISDLSPGIVYEIVYVVKLTQEASGWGLPLTLKLALPNGEVHERQDIMLEKPREEWIELNVGSFLAQEGETGEVYFDLYEKGGHWKMGLVIRGAILRPKIIDD